MRAAFACLLLAACGGSPGVGQVPPGAGTYCQSGPQYGTACYNLGAVQSVQSGPTGRAEAPPAWWAPPTPGAPPPPPAMVPPRPAPSAAPR